ncbi:MAG: glutaredoxin family protein [Coriobacteriia bacterium]
MQVTLYALSTCPYCRMTKKFLDKEGVDYELIEVDLLEGETGDPSTPKGQAVAKVKELSGGTSFPVIKAGDEVVVGFNKPRIKELLGL